MKRFTCPKCSQDTISIPGKYLTSHWVSIHCPSCGTRLCAEPILMALAYVVYFWAAVWFVTWAMVEESWILVLYLIPIWLLIDLFSVSYMPLRVMRPKAAQRKE